MRDVFPIAISLSCVWTSNRGVITWDPSGPRGSMAPGWPGFLGRVAGGTGLPMGSGGCLGLVPGSPGVSVGPSGFPGV